MGLSSSTAINLLNSMTGKGKAVTSYTTVYASLSSTKPDNHGANFTEPVGNGFERPMVGNSTQSLSQLFTDPVYDEVLQKVKFTNGVEIHFKKATGSWGTLGYLGLFSTASGTTPFAWTPLVASIQPTTNTVVVFEKEQLTFTLI